MEIKPREIIYNIVLVKRFRIILLLLVRVPLPILAAILVIQFIIRRYVLSYAPSLKLNTEIFFYPLCFVVGAAVLSTPFILFALFNEKRRAWLITFFVMFVLPSLLGFLIAIDNIFSIPWMIVLMTPFYLYCYLLKHTVSEWIEEYEGQELRKERKREEAFRMKEEERWM